MRECKHEHVHRGHSGSLAALYSVREVSCLNPSTTPFGFGSNLICFRCRVIVDAVPIGEVSFFIGDSNRPTLPCPYVALLHLWLVAGVVETCEEDNCKKVGRQTCNNNYTIRCTTVLCNL